jgi:hypothetical protein
MQNFEQFPFRNSADKKVINDALNNIRSFVNKTNQDEIMLEGFFGKDTIK